MHSRFREEFLNREAFASVLEAKVRGGAYRHQDNAGRPPSSLDYQTPSELRHTAERMPKPNPTGLLGAPGPPTPRRSPRQAFWGSPGGECASQAAITPTIH